MKSHPILRIFLAAFWLGCILGAAPAADFTATWNGTSGNWSNASKWNTNPLFPNNGNGGFTFDAVQNGGEITLDQNITIDGFTMNGGVLNGASALTTNTLLIFTGGGMDGSGAIHANGGVQFSGGNLKNIYNRTFNIGANSTWTGGTLGLVNSNVVVQSGATFTTDFDGTMDSNIVSFTGNFTVNSGGTFTKSGGSGATIIGTGTGGANGDNVAEVTFNNHGTTNVNSGTLSLVGGGNSTGAFNVADGKTLSFGGIIAGGGNIHVHDLSGSASVNAANATVMMTGGYTNLGATTTYNAGATQVTGGEAYFNNAATTGTLNLSSGAVAGSGSITASGMTTFTGGTMKGTGTTLANGGATLSTGTLNVNSGRNFNIGGAGVSTWNSGTLAITSGGTVRVLNGATLDMGFDGTMDSNFFASTGHFTIDAGGTFTKSAGAGIATVGTGSGGANGDNVAEVTFNNNGTANINSGTLSIIGGGTSTGAFNIAAGATLRTGGSSFGSNAHNHNFNAGTSIEGAGSVLFAGGISTLASGTTYDVGATQVTGGITNFNASASSGTLSVSGGTLGGSGSLTVSGMTTLTGGTITGAAAVNANGGVNFSGSGSMSIINSRVLNISGTSSWTDGNIILQNTGGGQVGPQINNLAGSVFVASFTGNRSITGDTSTGFTTSGGLPTFNNAGTFTKTGDTGTLTFANLHRTGVGDLPVALNNTGTVNVNNGTLTLSGGVTQHSGSTLTAGTWNVRNGAAIDITTGSNMTTNGAASTVLLDGAGSSFNRLTTALNNNQGSFTIKNDRDLTTAGALANSGSLRVEDSTTALTVNGAYTQSGSSSSTTLTDGADITASSFSFGGGSINGTGDIFGNLTTTGGTKVSPGLSGASSIGALSLHGDGSFGSSSDLFMQLGGTSQGSSYDYFSSTGSLSLGGILSLQFINNFESFIQLGEIFTLATAGSPILGSFSNAANGSVISDQDNLGQFSIFYGAGSTYGANNVVLVSLTQAPEPGRALLALIGLASLALRRRRSDP